MTDRTTPEVLIVGAGPTGLVLACELRRRGLAVRVVDRAEGPARESRALGLQARTLEIFDAMGCVEDIVARGRVLTAMNAYADGRRLVHLRWGLEDRDTPYPFELVLPQNETVAVLLARSAELGAEVEWNTELVGVHPVAAGVEAYLRTGERVERAEVGWLVGADGASSTVRRAADVPFEGDTYAQRFFLADVRIDWDVPDDQGHVFLLPDGPLVAFPYPDPGRWRVIDASDQRADPSPRAAEHFQALLDRAGVRAVVADVAWSSLFRFHRRIVTRSRVGRTLLAGDASHVHSPATAQGLNTGVQDAFNLGWKLALVVSGAAPDTLLDTYPAERLPVARDVLRESDRMTRLILLRSGLLQRLRNRVVRTLLSWPAVEHRVARGMSGLDRLLPGSTPAAAGTAGGGIPVGARLPSVPLAHPEDAPALLPFLRDTRLTLLVFPDEGGDPRSMADTASSSASRWAPHVAVVRIGSSPVDAADGVELLLDPAGHLRSACTAGRPGFVLVRPDGYVAAKDIGAVPDAVDRYLTAHLVPSDARTTSGIQDRFKP